MMCCAVCEPGLTQSVCLRCSYSPELCTLLNMPSCFAGQHLQTQMHRHLARAAPFCTGLPCLTKCQQQQQQQQQQQSALILAISAARICKYVCVESVILYGLIAGCSWCGALAQWAAWWLCTGTPALTRSSWAQVNPFHPFFKKVKV